MSNITGWSRGLEVSGGGQGVVSHAGLALLRHLADKTGLAGGLSRALASQRMERVTDLSPSQMLVERLCSSR